MRHIHRILAAMFVLFLAAVAAQAQGPVLQLTTDAGTPLLNGSSYNYGTLLAGNSTQNSLRVRNIGNQTLTLSATLSGGSGVFAVDFSPSSLGPGASNVIVLRFSGSVPGTFTGTLTLTTNDPSHNPVSLALTGTLAPPAAIPSVQYNLPSPVAKVVPGDAFDIGSATAPGFITRDFSIQNIGSSALNLTNLATIFSSCPGFSFTQAPPSSLTPTSSAAFTIKFQQASRGTYNCTVSFAHNGAGNNPFSFTITAHTLAPVLVVSSDGTQIFNNAAALNMGSTPLGTPISRTFTITNNGDTALSLSGLSSGSSAFTISGFPFSVASSGGSASFMVTFKALNAGTNNSQYSFGTSDPQFPTFTLNVQATGVGPAMTVTDPGSASVANGSTYAYGSTPQGVSTSRLFTIGNSGNTALTISNFALSNPDGGYSILTSPAASVAGPGSTNFRIRLLSNVVGSHSATVTFNTNDPNFPTFTLNLTGTVTSTAGSPTIRVTTGDGTNIPNGGSFTFPATTLGTSVSRAFIIYNDGTADLVLSNPTGLVSGTGFGQGQVPPTTPIPPGGNSTFRVNLSGATHGTFNGTVTIQSNDTAHTPFTFAVHGTVN